MSAQQLQVSEYVNEVISALEHQRNMALKEAAEATARANVASRQLQGVLKVIKDKGLEKHFFAEAPKTLEQKKKDVSSQKAVEAKKQKPSKVGGTPSNGKSPSMDLTNTAYGPLDDESK